MKKSIGAKPLAYPTPTYIVGTYDEEGNPNAATIAWAGISKSNPPWVSIKISTGKHSFKNIVRSKVFTVSIPSEKYMKEVDYMGIVSGSKEDKFKKTGLTPVKAEYVDAPYVKEFSLNLECKVVDDIDLDWDKPIIGEIVDIKADEEILNDKGLPDIKKLKPLIYAPGTKEYYGVGEYVGKAFSAGLELKK